MRPSFVKPMKAVLTSGRPAGAEWVRRGGGGELFYYVFDVLVAGGRDLRSLPLEERRSVLEGVVRWTDPLRMTEQVRGGYTAPRGSRTDLGAILVGHFDGDALRYGVDVRRAVAPPVVPRPALRQARARGRARGAVDGRVSACLFCVVASGG